MIAVWVHKVIRSGRECTKTTITGHHTPARQPTHERRWRPNSSSASAVVWSCRSYRYWPVLLAVSMARPVSVFLPVTRVRM